MDHHLDRIQVQPGVPPPISSSMEWYRLAWPQSLENSGHQAPLRRKESSRSSFRPGTWHGTSHSRPIVGDARSGSSPNMIYGLAVDVLYHVHVHGERSDGRAGLLLPEGNLRAVSPWGESPDAVKLDWGCISLSLRKKNPDGCSGGRRLSLGCSSCWGLQVIIQALGHLHGVSVRIDVSHAHHFPDSLAGCGRREHLHRKLSDGVGLLSGTQIGARLNDRVCPCFSRPFSQQISTPK
ncbi:hypothetical protein BO71DRAFT_400524 [Aspergillus ellipticus CBS 707.79]|uniref:Uncharacterized protein n=1 Tax=Aspergillus ellipticus CBS 707.79 TaxID=1448320 RepID=A0A319DDV6_9EURO|nr:hypothetical protein BO71DRAFT_400524 [Aspergillus ellipticus CBS 707.79]